MYKKVLLSLFFVGSFARAQIDIPSFVEKTIKGQELGQKTNKELFDRMAKDIAHKIKRHVALQDQYKIKDFFRVLKEQTELKLDPQFKKEKCALKKAVREELEARRSAFYEEYGYGTSGYFEETDYTVEQDIKPNFSCVVRYDELEDEMKKIEKSSLTYHDSHEIRKYMYYVGLGSPYYHCQNISLRIIEEDFFPSLLFCIEYFEFTSGLSKKIPREPKQTSKTDYYAPVEHFSNALLVSLFDYQFIENMFQLVFTQELVEVYTQEEKESWLHLFRIHNDYEKIYREPGYMKQRKDYCEKKYETRLNQAEQEVDKQKIRDEIDRKYPLVVQYDALGKEKETYFGGVSYEDHCLGKVSLGETMFLLCKRPFYSLLCAAVEQL